MLADGRYSLEELVTIFGVHAGVPLLAAFYKEQAEKGVAVLRRAGVPAADCRKAGVDAREMILGGYKPIELCTAGFTDEDLVGAGLGGKPLSLARGVFPGHEGAVYSVNACTPTIALSASEDGSIARCSSR